MKMAAGSTGKHRNQVFNRAAGARATAFPRGDGANAARRDARTALGGVGMPQNRRWKVSRVDDENGRILPERRIDRGSKRVVKSEHAVSNADLVGRRRAV